MTKHDLKELSSTLVFLVFSLLATILLSLAEIPNVSSNTSDKIWIIAPIGRFICVFVSQLLVSEWILRRYTGAGKLLLSVVLGLILGIGLSFASNLLG